MAKTNLLIREKKLPKNQIIEQKNREVSQEGKARKQDEVNLQAGIQKSLSDIVREDGAVSDERAKEWEDSLEDRFAGKPERRPNRGGWRRTLYPNV